MIFSGVEIIFSGFWKYDNYFNSIKYPKPSFLVPPQGLCFKSDGNVTCQDLTLRTITKGHNNDYFQSWRVLAQYHVGFLY